MMQATHHKRTALVAGLGLLLMAVLAAASNFGVIEPNRHDLPGFATGNPAAFGLTILALLVVAILDILVALALWRLFSSGQQALARLTAWFRLAYAAVFVVATALLSLAGRLAGSELEAMPLVAFDAVWNAGLLLFGLHLLLLGLLLWRSGPSWLGALVGIAGLGYAADTAITLLSPGSGLSISGVTFVGEVVLLVWLLLKAGRWHGPATA